MAEIQRIHGADFIVTLSALAPEGVSRQRLVSVLRFCEDGRRTREEKLRVLLRRNTPTVFIHRLPRDCVSFKERRQFGQEPYPDRETALLYFIQFRSRFSSYQPELETITDQVNNLGRPLRGE
jgi:hypothetical protein